MGQLVKGASDAQVEEIIDNLCSHLEKAGSSHRDVATLGLKSVITELTSASGAAKTIGKKLTPRILKTASDVRLLGFGLLGVVEGHCVLLLR